MVVAGAMCGCPLSAQEVRVQIAHQEPPHYVGEAVLIQFQVEGLDEAPQPTCELISDSGSVPDGLRGQVTAVSPSVMSQIVQRNGQLFQSRRVTFQINFSVTADREGDFEVGPFRIRQGNKEAVTEAISMSFRAVPLDPGMLIRLIIPDKPLYPDQRVPIEIEWWYPGDFEKLKSVSIYSPLFDQFRFAPDEQAGRRSTLLPITTKEGTLQLVSQAREEQLDGKRVVVLSSHRTLIPDGPGEYSLAPISVTIRRVLGWTRGRPEEDDGFGFGRSIFRDLMEERRRPTKVEVVRAEGEPLKLVIRPFPKDGRPESFSGAVGKGFSIDVAADRTVVRVGDPIGLSITLRGDGNIDNASLPLLSADGGLNPEQFRFPSGDLAGTLADASKQFHVSVRVADESVTEIPSLAYSWFDPETESYQTARSKPIALRVMAGKLVSASDVVRASPATNGAESNRDATASDSRELAHRGSTNTRLHLSGADLTIEPNGAVVLLDRRSSWTGLRVPLALYGAGVLAVVVAWLDRRRRERDPQQSIRRRFVRDQLQRISQATSLPQREAAQQIADAMRRLMAEFPNAPREAAQAIVAECESITYARDASTDQPLERSLVMRARGIAQGFAE